MNEFPVKKAYLKMEALAAVRRGDIPLAIEKYREYLALNPQDDDAWAGIGGAYRRMDDITHALNSYEEAYRINPQSTYALVNIISLLAARGSPKDREKLKEYLPTAIQLSKKIIDEGKGDYWTWYDLATLQLIQGMIEEGKTEEAIKTFYYAVELTPETAKENFRSVLNNLNFLHKHNPSIPQISKVIEMINQRLS